MPGYQRALGNRLVRGGRRSFNAGATPAAPGRTTFFYVRNDSQVNHGYYKTGLVFEKGEVPSGSIPVVKKGETELAAQFSERKLHSDGSLFHCTCFVRDTDWDGVTTQRDFDVYVEAGSYNDTGSLTLSDVTTNYDFKVTVANCTINGTATTRPNADGDGAFNTHSAISTRLTKIYSGPICEGWKVWGYVGSGPDTDLIVFHYVEVYKTAVGARHHARYAPVLELTRWQSTTKARLDYDCTVKDGATTLATFTGVEHPYHSTWAGIDNSDTVNEGKPHVIGVTAPKFIYVHDWEKWSRTGILPMIDWTQTPAAASAVTSTYGGPFNSRYIPCENMDHRSAIGMGGSYPGRGNLNHMDIIAACLGTHADYRIARVNAFAGLHIPEHYRDDTTNRIKALKLDGHGNTNGTTPPAGAIDYDFTSDGMPAPVDAYRDGRTDPAYADSFGDGDGTNLNLCPGGDGVWTRQGGSMHRHVYTKFMWLVEREHYMLQCLLDGANASAQSEIGSGSGARPDRLWPRNIAMTAGTEQFGGIAGMTLNSPRAQAWGQQAVHNAAMCIPDGMVETSYIKAYSAHNLKYFARSITENMSSDLLASGLMVGTLDMEVAMWMENFNEPVWRDAYKALESADALTVVQHCSKAVIGQWNIGQYATAMSRSLIMLNGGTWNASTNPFLAADQIKHGEYAGSISAATDKLTVASPGPPYEPLPFQDGDEVWFSNVSVTVPSEVSLGTKYYVVNAETISGTAPFSQVLQISATPGGAPIAFGSDYGSIMISGFQQASDDYATAQDPPFIPPPFDPTAIAWAAVCAAEDCGVTGAAAAAAIAETFVSTMDFAQFPGFNYKRTAA